MNIEHEVTREQLTQISKLAMASFLLGMAITEAVNAGIKLDTVAIAARIPVDAVKELHDRDRAAAEAKP